MLIRAAVNILECELGIFNLKIGKNLGFLALGMVLCTGTNYYHKGGKTLVKTVFSSMDKNKQKNC
jgi:hypothetical protein